MFNRLKQKWNVTTKQFWIIFIVFGCTGTTTAYLTKTITSIIGFTHETSWVWKFLLRLGMLLIGYQILLLFFAAIFGQWKFFFKYEKKLLQTLRITKKSRMENIEPVLKNVAIFASGAGSNAEKIIHHFAKHITIRVSLIVCNKPGAGVIDRARENNIPVLMIDKEKFFRGNGYVDELKDLAINFIVLAGFLWKIPATLISAYRNKIINIHPALLPKHGGKGMYGENVHRAVIEAGERESGITIHYVDEHYDNGDVIMQAKCEVLPTDTPASLARRIHQLEHEHFPKTVERLLME